MWMGSLSWKTCCNALCETKNFYTKLIMSEKVKNKETRNLQGSPWTFSSPYMMIRLLLSRKVN